MVYLTFAMFFAFNFSLWFMLPALLLKNIIKPGRKKKDKHIKFDYIIFNAGAYSVPRKICDAGYNNIFQINKNLYYN